MPKTRLYMLLSVLCASLPAGCSLQTLNLLASKSAFKRTADIAYGPAPRQRLDVYTPAAAAPPAPVILFFYGGSWSSGDKNDYLYVASAMARRGFVTVVPDYRLYPKIKFPAFIEDGAAAVAWVQRHISGYGGDARNIVLVGYSAGAHIAALLNLDERYLRTAGAEPVQGMIGLAGPYDFLPFNNRHLEDMFGPPESYPESQPVNFVDGTEPPLLLLHGARDTLVDPRNAERLADRVKARGGCARTRIYPRLDHITLLVRLSPVVLKPGILRQIEDFAKDPGCKNQEPSLAEFTGSALK